MKKRLMLLVWVIICVIIVILPKSHATPCEKFVGNECAELQWEFVHTGMGEVAEITISPSNPNIMYAGIEVNSHSLYKSKDGGKTWRRVNGGGDHTKDVAVSPKDPNKVYFAMSDTIHSTDLSIRPTVRSLTSPARPRGETIDIFSFGRLAGIPGGLLSTLEIFDQNDKMIYTAITGGSLGPRITSKPIIFKTVDGGNRWQSIEPNLEDISVIGIHPTNHELIYIGTHDGLYVSKDSGKTVEKLKTTSALGGFISVELQKGNPNVIYIASSSEVLKSEDAGKTWNDITSPLSDIHRVRVSRSHPNVLYASTFNGVFRSDDYGRTWIDKTSNLKGKNIQIVTIHPKNPDIAFVGHSSLWSSVRASMRFKHGLWADNGIFKTIDGGNSWFRSDDGMFEYNLEEVAVSPHRPNEAWVAAPASIGGHKTIDAAHDWLLTQIHTLHYPMRIKYSLQNPDRIYATSWHPGGPFAVSEDGGASWRSTNEREFFKGINRGKNLYSSGTGQQIEPIHLHGLAIDPNDDKVVYAGSVHDTQSPGEHLLEGAHIWKSIDSGKTWHESDEGFPHEKHTAIHDIQIDPKNSNVIYVATTEHEAEIGIGIYKSTDAGKTWEAVNNGLTSHDLSVGSIAIHPENTQLLIAATHRGIYKSTNGGQLWKKTSSSHSFDVEYVKNEPNTVYASTNEGVLKSRHFGDTWYKVNYGLLDGEGQGIGVSIDGNVIYTAVKLHGVYAARIKPVAPIEPVSVITNRGFEYTFGIETREFSRDVSRREVDRDKESLSSENLGIESKSQEIKTRKQVTLEECLQYDYPDDCKFIEDSKGVMDCEECKKLIASKKELLEKKSIKKGSIFTRVINFFKRIFSLGVKQDDDMAQSSVPQPSSKIQEQPEQIKENPEVVDEPQQYRQESVSSSKENKLPAIQKECANEPLIPPGKYQGLLTDVHVHTMIRDNAFDFALKLLEEMNEQGVDRIVIQPNHDPTTIVQNAQLDKNWGEIAAVCPRIIPMIYGFNPDEPNSWTYVKERLDTGNYGGVGEIEFRHGNFDIKHNPESDSMVKIYQILNERGLALHFQASIQRDPSLEEKMFKIIQRYPNTSFIWFGGCPFTEKFIRLPNLYCDIFLHSEAYLPQTNILQKSIIGSDAGPERFWYSGGLLPYRSFGEAMEQAREKLEEIPANVKDPLAHGNFNKIWKKY